MTTSRRVQIVLFVVSLFAYSYFYQAGGWNQNVRFDLSRSIVEKQSFIIDDYLCGTPHPPTARPHRNTGDESKRGDHYYCDKAPGVSWLAVPAYAITHGVHGRAEKTESFLGIAAYISTVFAIALPSALSVVALFMLLGALNQRFGVRVLLSVGYAFGTLAWPYSTLLYGHQLAAALLLCALTLLVRARHQGAKPHLFVVGLLLGFSVVSEYPAALGVIPIFIYALIHHSRKEMLWLIAGGAVCAISLAAYHWIAFGGPFTLPYEFSTQKYRGLGYFMGLGVPNWPAFSNTMFTAYRGLFYSAPWLLLGFGGSLFMILQRRFRAESIVSLSIVLLFVWMTSSLIDSWHGGWSLGSRYMIPAIPFLVIPIAGLFSAVSDKRKAKARVGLQIVLAAAIGYSALLMLAGTAVRPEVPQHIKRPFTAYLLPNFYKGKVSLNPQSINRAEPGPKLEAWNLGQKAGLQGFASLLPLLLVMGAAGAYLMRLSLAEGKHKAADP
jgi:MFS family permease